jgi:hypothetical protein
VKFFTIYGVIMKLFLVTFGVFILIILAMALGYIVKRQALKGSCGGLSSLGIAKACDCDKPCDTFQEKLDAGDENAKAEYEQKFANKAQSQFYEVK